MEDLRRFLRARVPEEKLIPCQGIGIPLTGQVSVFGPGGMYIRTKESYPVGTELELKLDGYDGPIRVRCRVCEIEPGGLGVEFVALSEAWAKSIQNTFLQLSPRP